MAATKTRKTTKKTSKRKTSKRGTSRKKKTALDKMKKDSLSLNAKDLIAVIGGVMALALSVTTILGWKFVSDDEFSAFQRTIESTIREDNSSVQRRVTSSNKDVDDKVFKLKLDDQELEKSIKLLEKEDEHLKQKIQEVVVRQENTDRKVERIDKNIVMLLEQNRLQPAPAPALRPLPSHYEEEPADDGE